MELVFLILGVMMGFLIAMIFLHSEREKHQKKFTKFLKKSIDDINKVRNEK